MSHGTVNLPLETDYRELRDAVRRVCDKFPGEYWRKLDAKSEHPTEFDGALTTDDLNKYGWNRLHIVARGNHMWFSINGRPASEFTDHKPEQLKSGIIGLQIHDAGMVVEFKDIWLKKIEAAPD